VCTLCDELLVYEFNGLDVSVLAITGPGLTGQSLHLIVFLFFVLFFCLTVERCPRLLEAAQTLYDIATHVARLNQDGILRRPKELLQKAMKARRTKSIEKPEDVSAASTSSMGSDHMSRSGMDQIKPTKRPKPSTIRDKKDLDHIDSLRKRPINWPAPKSRRASPIKLIRDSIAESRHSAAYILKEACMMPPPPAKVLNRTCNGQQKVRKLMQMD